MHFTKTVPIKPHTAHYDTMKQNHSTFVLFDTFLGFMGANNSNNTSYSSIQHRESTLDKFIDIKPHIWPKGSGGKKQKAPPKGESGGWVNFFR